MRVSSSLNSFFVAVADDHNPNRGSYLLTDCPDIVLCAFCLGARGVLFKFDLIDHNRDCRESLATENQPPTSPAFSVGRWAHKSHSVVWSGIRIHPSQLGRQLALIVPARVAIFQQRQRAHGPHQARTNTKSGEANRIDAEGRIEGHF